MEHDLNLDAVERWFVHRGVPQAIFHYNASEDVLTRMVPYLVATFLLGSLAGFGDRFQGWKQFLVALGAFAILTAVALGVNRLRGRRLLALPDDIGIIEIGAFLLGAPLIALIFGQNAGRLWWQLLLLNIALLAGGYLLTTYGIVPMFRWGLREVVVQLRGIVVLLARSLPLLLLFATFLFLNAEMWQVAHDLTPSLYAMTIGLVLLPALLFIVLRSPTEVAHLHRFADGAKHFHLWVLGRPAGQLELFGWGNIVWAQLLPPIADEIRDANHREVVAELAAAHGGELPS